MKLNKIEMVHHHVCYEEIHGYDLVILMPKSEHTKLHQQLRKEGKCDISVGDLRRISMHSNHHKKYQKKNYNRIDFYKTLIPNVDFHESIQYNYKTGNVTYSANFRSSNGKKLWYHNVL